MSSPTDDADTLTGGPDLESLRAEAGAAVAVVHSFGAASSRGSVRSENEDVFGSIGQSLFVVADGMGGHAGGRMAATIAVQSVLSTATSAGIGSFDDVFRRVSAQVSVACRARGFERAGTTLIVASIVDSVVTIASVGDSRVYRLRNRTLDCLTSDHTVFNELQALGLDPNKQRRTGLHALTRHVGSADGNHVPDVTTLVPHGGDQLLLATDGVFKQLSDAEMASCLHGVGGHGVGAQEAADALVCRADLAGGRDNATALVIHFADDDRQED